MLWWLPQTDYHDRIQEYSTDHKQDVYSTKEEHVNKFTLLHFLMIAYHAYDIQKRKFQQEI